VDNIPFYKNLKVQQAIENAGYILSFTIIYSIFAYIKIHVWRQNLQDHETLLSYVNYDVKLIPPNMLQG
jgi:hypothetical protein